MLKAFRPHFQLLSDSTKSLCLHLDRVQPRRRPAASPIHSTSRRCTQHIPHHATAQALKKDGASWAAKYARGGSARKLSARKFYVAVDMLQVQALGA